MKNYKEAEIYYGSKTGKDIKKQWYVFYYFRNPNDGKFKRFIEKKGINREHTITARTEQAKLLREAINQELKSGYNPFSHIEVAFQMTFSQAMDYGLAKKEKTRSRKTYLDYRSHTKFIKLALQRTFLSEFLITEVKRGDIKRLLYDLKDNHSINTVNKYLGVLKAVFTILLEDEIIEVSPVHGIKEDPLPQKPGYTTLNNDLKKQVKELAYADNQYFGLICEIIYETGIRPNEVLSLKWENINYTDLSITVIESKNSKIRVVPIKQSISDKLKDIQSTGAYPNKWYLFGSPITLESGPERFHRNRLSERWARVMHKDGKLPTDLKLYGLKHTGADDKIMAGISLEYLKEIYGHHSTKMTRIYAKKISQKAGDVIRKDAPDF